MSKMEAAFHTGSATPALVWATPLKHEAWRCYIGEKIKVRELNTGIVQVAGLDGDWEEVK